MPPASCLHPQPARIYPNPNPNSWKCSLTAWQQHGGNYWNGSSPALPPSSLPQSLRFSSSPATSPSFCSSNSNRYSSSMQRSKCSLKYAVLGAGFAGLSVAWHLLKHSPKESHVSIDIYDEAGIGGGASGASGGLLHPYSPKGKVLWRGADCWKECLQLISTAERAVEASDSNRIALDSSHDFDDRIVLRRQFVFL